METGRLLVCHRNEFIQASQLNSTTRVQLFHAHQRIWIMSDTVNIPELAAKAALDGCIHDFEEIGRAIGLIIENDSHALRALQLSGPDDKSVWEIGTSTAQKGLAAVKQVLGNYPLAQVFVQLNPTGLVECVGDDTTGMDRLAAEC